MCNSDRRQTTSIQLLSNGSNTDDINTIVEEWSRLFSLILEKHAPIRNKRVSEKFSPWLTKDFHTMSATRDRIR